MRSRQSPALVTRRQMVAATAAAAASLALERSILAQESGGSSDALALQPLKEASNAVRAKRVSSVELARACLDRIDRHAARNTFVTVTAEQALARAQAMDAEIAQGAWRGPLHGIPIAPKDNVDTAGVRTTAASAVFADRVPSEDAEVVLRLERSGAVLLGKLNPHEFAFGGGAVSYYGPMRAPARVAGDPPAGRASRSPQAFAMAPWERTREARSAIPRPTAESWARSPPTAGRAIETSFRSAGPSITWAR